MSLTRWRSPTNSGAEPLDFRYGLLKSAKTGIRLAQIQPGTGNKGISITLVDSYVTGPQQIQYDALSYTWGDPDRSKKTIACNGKRLAVTKTLLVALQRFRDPDNVVTLWIDQICICQERIKERNQQVKLMDKVFKGARKVIVWLGEDDDDSQAGMQLLKQLRNIARYQHINGLTLADLDFHGLPGRGHRKWKALSSILRRGWFWRTWIVQEVVLNPNVELVLGSPTNPTITWNDLERVVALLEGPIPTKWQVDQAISPSELPFSRINRIRLCHQRMINTPSSPNTEQTGFDGRIFTEPESDVLEDDQEEDPQLLDLLLLSRSLGATDPRDKIYALLGLSQHNVDPDYSKSTKTVFTQFAQQTIAAAEEVKKASQDVLSHQREVRRALVLISCAGRHHQRLLLPSWVPDWTMELSARPLVFGVGRKFTAGGIRLGLLKQHDDHSLEVCGKLLDTINSAGEVLLDFDTSSDDFRSHQAIERWWDEARQIALSRIARTPGSTAYVDAFDALRRDLSLDRNGYFTVTAKPGRTTSLFDDFDVADESKPSAAQTLTLGPTRGRVMVSTTTGYVGLAPYGSREGDVIFIVVGADVPYILRPLGDGYELIGEAYCQGVMGGEIMERDDIVVQDVHLRFVNRPAKGISYFTPAQDPPAGTALVQDGDQVPKLFQPLKLRGLTLQNRIMLSPLCQYSAEDGHYTMWHLTHIGGLVQRGPGLTCIEATAVTPEGRITPEDVGLWKDSQIENLSKVVEFAHSQSQKIMIQLAHAGRKASTVAPWLSSGAVAGEDVNGWPDNVIAPSAIPWNEHHAQPREMTLKDIDEFKVAYGAAVKRALKAGFDVIEIHNAHGYLLHEFLSPVSNKRTDKYGGSFENRTRLTLEVVELVRSIIPKDMPLFLRISATDYLEEAPKDVIPESWTGEDTVKLAPLLAEAGVDFLDVSGGGMHPLQHPHTGPAYQSKYAIAAKKAVGDKMKVGSVGSINTAQVANDLLEKDDLDMVIVGRAFQKNPGLVFTWADELGQMVRMPNQIAWGFAGRGQKNDLEPLKA